jgi:zinc transporter ZupT
MMSVLEKVSPEVRRRTGWLLPVAIFVGLGIYLPDESGSVDRAQQLWMGGLGLAGVLVGMIWQWFSPRQLADRLALAAGAFVVVAILMLVPLAGEWTRHDQQLSFGLGVISGLVIANWWKLMRTED